MLTLLDFFAVFYSCVKNWKSKREIFDLRLEAVCVVAQHRTFKTDEEIVMRRRNG